MKWNRDSPFVIAVVFLVLILVFQRVAARPVSEKPYVVSVTQMGNIQKLAIVKVGTMCQAVYEVFAGPQGGVHSSSAVAVTSWSVTCP